MLGTDSGSRDSRHSLPVNAFPSTRARKISAFDYDVRYLKASILTQLLASLPLGYNLKNFRLDELSTSIHL